MAKIIKKIQERRGRREEALNFVETRSTELVKGGMHPSNAIAKASDEAEDKYGDVWSLLLPLLGPIFAQLIQKLLDSWLNQQKK